MEFRKFAGYALGTAAVAVIALATYGNATTARREKPQNNDNKSPAERYSAFVIQELSSQECEAAAYFAA